MPRIPARGERPALHRERRGARLARRDDREYREYLREEQRSQVRGPQRGTRVGVEEGCIAVRMQLDFHHGLPSCGPPGGRPIEGDRRCALASVSFTRRPVHRLVRRSLGGGGSLAKAGPYPPCPPCYPCPLSYPRQRWIRCMMSCVTAASPCHTALINAGLGA
jgi:hypothetical protein